MNDELRKFPGLAEDHPLVGKECPACHKDFNTGDEVTLVTLGPGSDSEEQRKAREGRAYTAVAAAVHWTCATGQS